MLSQVKYTIIMTSHDASVQLWHLGGVPHTYCNSNSYGNGDSYGNSAFCNYHGSQNGCSQYDYGHTKIG